MFHIAEHLGSGVTQHNLCADRETEPLLLVCTSLAARELPEPLTPQNPLNFIAEPLFNSKRFVMCFNLRSHPNPQLTLAYKMLANSVSHQGTGAL